MQLPARFPLTVAIWTVVACLLMAAADPARADGAVPAYVPKSRSQVLEHLPSTSDPRVRAFDALKRRVQARPQDLPAAVALARAYLDYGRDTGDARYLGRAQAVIAPWARKRPAPDEAMVVQATILQSRHQFAESRTLLQSVLAHDPGNTQAWLTLSSVALVQGDMGVAQNACRQLLLSGDVLVTAGCAASWATANGRAANALDSLDRLLPQSTTAPPALLSWVHGLQADAAKVLGRNARADAEFRRALQLAPGDNFLIADFADFLLDQGRPKEALALTRDYSQSDTSFLRQVLAESALGLPSAPAHVATMAARFRDLETRGDNRLYGREEARFALALQHDPARALKLAQANWTIQHAPEDMRIFLEAALAAGRPESARAVLDFLGKTHFEDPVVRALAAEVSRRSATPVPAATVAPQKRPGVSR